MVCDKDKEGLDYLSLRRNHISIVLKVSKEIKKCVNGDTWVGQRSSKAESITQVGVSLGLGGAVGDGSSQARVSNKLKEFKTISLVVIGSFLTSASKILNIRKVRKIFQTLKNVWILEN